jgi:hypothetical protein
MLSTIIILHYLFLHLKKRDFFKKSFLEQYRFNQEMHDDCNCGYYTIISPVTPNLYGENFLGSQIGIADDVKKLVNVLKSNVNCVKNIII